MEGLGVRRSLRYPAAVDAPTPSGNAQAGRQTEGRTAKTGREVMRDSDATTSQRTGVVTLAFL